MCLSLHPQAAQLEPEPLADALYAAVGLRHAAAQAAGAGCDTAPSTSSSDASDASGPSSSSQLEQSFVSALRDAGASSLSRFGGKHLALFADSTARLQGGSPELAAQLSAAVTQLPKGEPAPLYIHKLVRALAAMGHTDGAVYADLAARAVPQLKRASPVVGQRLVESFDGAPGAAGLVEAQQLRAAVGKMH